MPDWTMTARGLVAAALLGYVASGFETPKHWPPFAWAVALCFFVGWVVKAERTRS